MNPIKMSGTVAHQQGYGEKNGRQQDKASGPVLCCFYLVHSRHSCYIRLRNSVEENSSAKEGKHVDTYSILEIGKRTLFIRCRLSAENRKERARALDVSKPWRSTKRTEVQLQERAEMGYLLRWPVIKYRRWAHPSSETRLI